MSEEGIFDTELDQLTPVDSLIGSDHHNLPSLIIKPSTPSTPSCSSSSLSPSLTKKNTKTTKKKRNFFILSLITMLICGSSNDYLGKLIYQNNNNLFIDYWITWILTAGSFFICSFALINGRKSFKILTFKMFFKICIPSFMDLFVTGGRYLAIIFLPAAIISILKNGFQLIFLSLFTRFYRKRNLTKIQWIGLFLIIIGLIIISLQDIISNIINHDSTQLKQATFGIVLLIIIGFFGAIRNMMEEILLQNDDINDNFLVGMESIISLLFMLIFAMIYLFTNSVENGGGYKHIYFITNHLLQN